MKQFVIIFMSISSFCCFSQQSKEIVNPTIDPEWHTVIEKHGFSWVYDMVHDRDGFIYVAGYFENAISIGELSVSSKGNKGLHSNDHLYICKLSPQGKPLWIQSAEGRSRAFKLLIDDNNDLLVLGEMYTKTLTFSTLDTGYINMINTGKAHSASFLCKYSSEGQLLQSECENYGYGQELIGMTLDKQQNIYVWGSYFYRDRGEVKRSHLIVKLNKEFKQQWNIKGDTVSKSQCYSLEIDKRNQLYVGISYHQKTTFKSQQLKDTKDKGSCLSKLTRNGKLIWLHDEFPSLAQAELRNVLPTVKITADKRPLFIAASYTKLYISSLNKKGELKDLQSIDWLNKPKIHRFRLTDDNHLLCFGNHYGKKSLGTVKGHQVSSKGNIGYVAQYDLTGQLIWAQTHSGNVVKAYSTQGKTYVLTKSFKTGKLQDTIITRRNQYACWVGQFDNIRLNKMDIHQMNHQYKRDSLKHQALCFCQDHGKRVRKNINLVTMKRVLEPKELFFNNNWLLDTTQIPFEGYFLNRFRYGNSHYGSTSIYRSFTLHTFKPAKLHHAQDAFNIIITPCQNAYGSHSINVGMRASLAMRAYFEPYELEDLSLDSTASVFEALNRMDQKENGYNHLINMLVYGEAFDYYLYEEEESISYDVNRAVHFINLLNKTYGIDLSLSSVDNGTFADTLYQRLERLETDLSIEEFILKNIVLQGSKNSKITSKDRKKLKELFGDQCFQKLKQAMTPKYTMSFYSGKMQLEINTQMLQAWDDMLPNETPATIMMESKEIKLNSEKNLLKASFKDICMTPTEISSTGITIDFRKMKILDHHKNKPFQFFSSNYPFLVIDSTLKKENQSKWYYTYETLATENPLVMVENATMEMPLLDQRVKVKGSNLVFNNYLITGKITFQIDDLQKVNPTLDFSKDVQEIIRKLRQTFLTIGVDKVKVSSISESTITFDFLKYAEKTSETNLKN